MASFCGVAVRMSLFDDVPFDVEVGVVVLEFPDVF